MGACCAWLEVWSSQLLGSNDHAHHSPPCLAVCRSSMWTTTPLPLPSGDWAPWAAARRRCPTLWCPSAPATPTRRPPARARRQVGSVARECGLVATVAGERCLLQFFMQLVWPAAVQQHVITAAFCLQCPAGYASCWLAPPRCPAGHSPPLALLARLHLHPPPPLAPSLRALRPTPRLRW